MFSLYSATFRLTKAGTYTGVVQLTQKGGLVAQYFETTEFQAPVNAVDAKNHTAGAYYTQIDANLDFDLGEKAMTVTGRADYPSEYFSVKWLGYLEPVYTETYRLYVEAYSTS